MSDSTRFQYGAAANQGPQPTTAALIRDRLATRRQRLDAMRPEVAGHVAAELVRALDDGRISEREAEYISQVLARLDTAVMRLRRALHAT